MVTIAIDPGYEGAICVNKNNRYTIYPMPLIKEGRQYLIDYNAVISILKKYKKDKPVCFVESQFRNSKTIDHCGMLKGIMITLEYELHVIHPSTWSAQMKKLPSVDNLPKDNKELEQLKHKTPNKYRNLVLCSCLFPKIKLSNEYWAKKHKQTLKRKLEYADGVADSLLINYYANHFFLLRNRK